MSDYVKRVNGHIIKSMTRDEMNDELIKKGDWGIEYYVPGRVLYGYFITIDRIRYRFSKFEKIEAFCKKYKPEDLKGKYEREINELIWDSNRQFPI